MAARTITPQPPRRIDSERFFARVRSAPRGVLVLDYDGTLAPFQLHPARAVPYSGVIELLDAIMDSPRTRLVIASGRWIEEILPLLGLQRRPEIWGCHGWERLSVGGEYQGAAIGARAVELLEETGRWASAIERYGARAELKPASVAIHWRGLPETRSSEIRAVVLQKWQDLGDVGEFAWHDFDGGIELRVAGRDKGDVVRTLVAEAGPSAAFAYLGDDRTDEDAFAAVPDHGAAVLVRNEFRPTLADLWIRPPEELLLFLARWHQAAENERA
jgi:trehalose-phosphatase